MIHEVHPYDRAVPTHPGMSSLRKSLENIKGESPIIKEEGDTKADDACVHSDLWDIWVMYVYSLVLPQKVNISLEGLHVLCLRWWKRKVVYGMFRWLEGKYRGFNRTQEGATLGGG